MKPSIVDLLVRPGAFFRNAVSEKERFTVPVLIVLVAGIMGSATAYLMATPVARMMAGAVPGIEVFMAIGTVIGAIVISFVFWIVWSGVFFTLSYAFKGQGTFRRTLEFVGYGYLPQIIGSLITLIIASGYIPSVRVPQLTTAGMQDPVLMEQTIKALMHDPAMMELSQIAAIISIVFLLWSANCWIFGMRNARQLSERDSALCVGIPVVASILFTIYNLGVM